MLGIPHRSTPPAASLSTDVTVKEWIFSKLVVVISVLPRVETILPPGLPLQHLLRIIAHTEVLQKREHEILPEICLALFLVKPTQLLIASVLGVKVVSPALGHASLTGRGANVEPASVRIRKAVDPSYVL